MKRTWILVVIFLIGLGIFLFPHGAQIVNNHLLAAQVDAFQTQLGQLSETKQKKIKNNARVYNHRIASEDTTYQDPFTKNDDTQTTHKNNIQAIKTTLGQLDGIFASLYIPKLGLKFPIYLGATDEHLAQGVAQVTGTSLPIGGKSTHTVIAGHRGMGMKEMFRNVDALDIGDRFIIYSVTGKLVYQIYDKEIILPNQTEALEIVPGKDLATLLTCYPYPYNSHRLLIHGKRVNDN